MDVDVILNKLDTVFEVLAEIKTNNNLRFDKVDQKIESVKEIINRQEKISLKHGMLIRGCKKRINVIDTRLNGHIDSHAQKGMKENEEKIKDTKEKTKNNFKLTILWSVAVFCVIQIGTIIFFILKGLIHFG